MTERALLGDFPEVLALEVAERRLLDLIELQTLVCKLLVERGLPLWRSSLGVETLHPELSGIQAIWLEGSIERTEAERAGILVREDYVNSPTYVVDQTDRPFRCRLEEGDAGMPLLARLRGQGATDYVMIPMPFADTTRSAAMSFVTRQPGGFTEREMAQLAHVALVVGPHAERSVLREIAANLLDTYVGSATGKRIFAGEIERGELRRQEAAIWFCDLRDYTGLSNRLPPERTVALLNAWFELLGDAVAAEEGEILKFLGDGFLAVFPALRDRHEACRQALAAARAAEVAMAREQERLDALAGQPLAFGLALHLGEVGFGNVGTRLRLDFTVIGPAVNLASRLQDLTKPLGRPLVASAAFVASLAEPAESLGHHAIRGFAEPVEVFAL